MLRDRLISSSTLGYMVLAAVRAFCYSADRDLGLPYFRAGRYGDVLDGEELAETKRAVIPYARDLLAMWWPVVPIARFPGLCRLNSISPVCLVSMRPRKNLSVYGVRV